MFFYVWNHKWNKMNAVHQTATLVAIRKILVGVVNFVIFQKQRMIKISPKSIHLKKSGILIFWKLNLHGFVFWSVRLQLGYCSAINWSTDQIIRPQKQTNVQTFAAYQFLQVVQTIKWETPAIGLATYSQLFYSWACDQLTCSRMWWRWLLIRSCLYSCKLSNESYLSD